MNECIVIIHPYEVALYDIALAKPYFGRNTLYYFASYRHSPNCSALGRQACP